MSTAIDNQVAEYLLAEYRRLLWVDQHLRSCPDAKVYVTSADEGQVLCETGCEGVTLYADVRCPHGVEQKDWPYDEYGNLVGLVEGVVKHIDRVEAERLGAEYQQDKGSMWDKAD